MEGSGAMRSIDNLREYALTAASVNATTRAVLAGYVDEIEREVEELRDREYQSGREDAEGAAEFADRLCRAAERREDVTLWGVDYTPLPVDADGVPIHVGDVMDEQLPFGGYAAPAPVDTMELSRGAGGYGWMVRLDSESGAFINPKLLRHHHAPTVEDVLREFASDIADVLGGDDFRLDDSDELFAEYAAKLRLAGDE